MSPSAKTDLIALDFTSDIERLTQDFTGREWLLREVEQWLNRRDERFLILTGEPGVGKSAFAAWLIHTRKDIVAHNFCIAGRNDTIVPNTVLRSLGAQLGKSLPDYGKALANTIKPEKVSIDVKINVKEMTSGEITGVIINHLHASDPKEVLEITLRAPLAWRELPIPEKPVIILIDSLDEAVTYRKDLNLVTLLSGLNDLPPWIRIFCTSRPERNALGYFDGLSPHILAAESKMNLDDVDNFITHRIGGNGIQARIKSEGKKPEDLETELKRLHKGNFLFAKVLLDDIAAGRQSLEDLSALPKSIDEIYHGFLRRFKAQWEKRYQPILGTLAVVREPVTEMQLANFTGIKRSALRQSLGKIIQFLDEQGGGHTEKSYTPYHQSFRDYLLDEVRNVDFWCAPEDGHQSIADYYLKKCDLQLWDAYGFRNSVSHVLLSKQAEQVSRISKLFTRKYLDSSKNILGSEIPFLEDVIRILEKANPDEAVELCRLVLYRLPANSYRALRTLKTLVARTKDSRDLKKALKSAESEKAALAKAILILASQKPDRAFQGLRKLPQRALPSEVPVLCLAYGLTQTSDAEDALLEEFASLGRLSRLYVRHYLLGWCVAEGLRELGSQRCSEKTVEALMRMLQAPEAHNQMWAIYILSRWAALDSAWLNKYRNTLSEAVRQGLQQRRSERLCANAATAAKLLPDLVLKAEMIALLMGVLTFSASGKGVLGSEFTKWLYAKRRAVVALGTIAPCDKSIKDTLRKCHDTISSLKVDKKIEPHRRGLQEALEKALEEIQGRCRGQTLQKG